MPERIYSGPHAAVEVDLPDGRTITVARDTAGEFPDELLAGLDAQPDNWKTPKSPKTAASGKE